LGGGKNGLLGSEGAASVFSPARFAASRMASKTAVLSPQVVMAVPLSPGGFARPRRHRAFPAAAFFGRAPFITQRAKKGKI